MTETLNKREEDIQRLLIGGCHLGGKNCTKQMKKYTCEKKSSGLFMFNVQKQYEKIWTSAVRAQYCINNSAGGSVQSGSEGR